MHPITILIVEQSPHQSREIEKTLRCIARPVTVVMRPEADAIWSQESDSRVDVVLLNPGDDPNEIDRVVAIAVSRQPPCPVLVYSESLAVDTVIECIRMGGADFIRRQELADPVMLWDRIDSAVKRHRRDAIEKRRMERRIRQLQRKVELDPLTGLGNRRAIERILDRDGRRTRERRGDTCFAMLDIDIFKRVNDRMGHEMGDRVLQAVSREIAAMTGSRGVAARWGGEEFLIILPNTSLAHGYSDAEKLRERIASRLFDSPSAPCSVSVSIGLSVAPSRDISSDCILHADAALMLAKLRGRNQTCINAMVGFDELAANTPGGSVEVRIRDFIRICCKQLGPAQREHLTHHSERVSDLAVRVGRQLGMTDVALQELALAGLCHDLGKCCIPDTVLSKPDKLTPEERLLVARHAQEGGQLAAKLGAAKELSEAVRFHHVPYMQEGRGRTGLGLSALGAGTGLDAGILNVADTMATMLTEFSYQSARTLNQTLQEVANQSGRQFAPAIAQAAIKAMH
ncbi:Response regulator PleD [Phycisphaerae bacterium RAS2]|nr:Response regulator PleD [Phycisphaerae bacterium RAS2]